MLPRIAHLAARAALIAAFAAAGLWSARFACADYWFQQQTLAGTERAIALAPDLAAYQYRLALLASDDQPATAFAALRRAVALNPSDAQPWIDLGLRYEASGDPARAERCLLRAAAENAQYLPKWTLANYYFRHDDAPRFWLWARRAAAMAYGDPLPLFRLCGQMVEDGNLIDRLAIRDPSVRASYLAYLVAQDRVDLAPAAARRVLESGRPADSPLLLAVCDRMLERNRPDAALDLWNRLAAAHRIPFPVRNPAEPSRLTNAAFAVAPTSQGFDWRLPTVDGVSAAAEDNARGLRLTFSGSQPEHCEVLAQYVPVEPGRNYQLAIAYYTSAIAPASGLAWRVTAADSALDLAAPRDLSSDDETRTSLSFTAPPACRLVRLSLVYQRSLGTTRIAGFLVLRSADLR